MTETRPRNYLCAACGYRFLQSPQRTSNAEPSRECCPSCGFVPGETDEVHGLSHEQWRERWVEGGLQWFSPNVAKPHDWQPYIDMMAMLNRRVPVIPAHVMRRMQERSKTLADHAQARPPHETEG